MFHVPGCGLMEPADDHSHLDHDPRGLIKIFEPPDPQGIYAMGVDASGGIVNWNRDVRTDADTRTDNGAIEIVRKGMGEPDVQVAEFAAPITPEDLADIANFLGRLYAGRAEEEQAKCIVEIHPGPGMATQKRLMYPYHYYNLYQQSVPDSLQFKPTQHVGWVATEKAIRDMWGQASRHIKRRKVIINSPWLVEEIANIQMRPDLTYGAAVGIKHDDRLRAFMLAIYALHDWSSYIDYTVQKEVETTRVINYQATDCTEEDLMDIWEDAYQSMAEEDQ